MLRPRTRWRLGSHARVRASTVVTIGPTTAAAGFADHYVWQAMKHVQPQVKQVFQNLPTPIDMCLNSK